MNQPPATAAPQPAPTAPPNTADSSGKRGWFDRVARQITQIPHWSFALLQQGVYHWPWVLVTLMYLGAWWYPYQWAKDHWNSTHHVEMFQPFLPLATLFLVWARRDTVREVWERAQRKRLSRRVGFWERGNAVPLLLGCALLLLMHLIQMKGVAVIALILIGVGVAYHVFGWRVMRSIAAPLALLILMIPLPDSLIDRIIRMAHGATLQALVATLGLLRHPAVIEGSGIRYLDNNFTVGLTPIAGVDIIFVPVGVDIAVGAALALLVYGLYKRRNGFEIAASVLNGVILALLVNFARMLLICLIAERNPGIAERFKDYNAWVVVALVSVAAGYITRAQSVWWGRYFTAAPGSRQGSRFSYVLHRIGYFVSLPFLPIFIALGLAGRAGGGVGQMARRSEKRTERVLKWVSPVARVLLFPLTLLRRSERGMENLFRRFSKKRGRGSGKRYR